MKKQATMKKILLALVLSIVATVATKGSQVIGAITYNNTNRSVVVSPAQGTTTNVNLNNNSSVYLVHSYRGTTYVSSGGLHVVSALNQPNIWCAQSGSELDDGTFSVSGEYTVSDPSLAYILNQGPSMGSLQSNWISTAQIAFWEYLDRSSSSDARNINSGISNEFRYGTVKGYWDKITSADFDTAWGNGASIYEASKTYANSTGNVQPTVKLSLGSNGVDVTVGGQCTNYTLYIDGNRYNSYSKGAGASKVVTIPYTDSRLSGKSKVTIKAEASYSEYYAKYRLLKNSNKQRLLVLTDVGHYDRTTSAEASIDLRVNISLQKYIVQVNGRNITSAQTKLTNREDAYASPIDVPVFNGKKDNRPNYYYDSPSNPAAKNKAKTYKRQSSSSSPEDENVVYIEAGDTVTYRIKVYNNDKIDATRFVIGDTFPSAVATWVGAKNANGQTVSWTKQNDTQYYYSIPGGLKAGTSTYFDVTLKYTKYSPNLWTNCAYIEARNPNKTDEGHNFPIYTIPNAPAWGPGIYRTSDYDHIKMRPYKVSLEKFITKVEGNGKSETPSPSRAGKRCHDALPDNSTGDRNLWKRNNQYEIEPGDKVTYTIRLKNTGDYPVKITQIYDSFRYANNGVKLEYDSSYGIRGNGGGTIINNHYNGPNNDWGFDALDRKLIKFNNATLLSPGATTDVTIRFTVQIPKSLTTTAQDTIFNKAVIVEIQNRNNVIVTDSDGGNNNADNDYVKYSKFYSASLEKFITKVTDKNGGNAKTITGRDGKRYNDGAATKTSASGNYNTYKPNNNVEAEPGDIVTYTLRLKNTGSNPVKITQITDTFDVRSNGVKLVYNSSYGVKGNGNGTVTSASGKLTIKFNNATLLAVGATTDITLQFKVEVPTNLTNVSQTNIRNKASIDTLQNRNNVTVLDSDGTDNNADNDYVKTKVYAVKLEKYISRVNNTTRDAENTTLNRSGKPEHYNDNNANTTNNWKYNNVVVVGKGDEVTYTITVTNEHPDTSVYITDVIDTLPAGISQYKIGEDIYRNRPSNGKISLCKTPTRPAKIFLTPGQSAYVTVTVKVTESNLSLDVFKNEAEITEMKNRNQVTVIDTTLNNNKDADYFELKDITIHGKVWNDVARNKTNDSYNGKYESGKKEKLLEDITVRLFRNNTEVATTKTNNKGEYTFSRSNLNSNLADNTRYIKGPRNTPTNNRWSGTYYSYYVVFEYDGITYTCSLNNQQNPTYVPVNTSLPTDYKIDSNAAENNGKVNMTRENFNKQFTTIKNDGAYNANNQKSMNLEYDTKNENGYVPQSIHKTKANIQASTNLINLSNNNNLEEQLLNVDLGLRGRDIFDLHLDSSVAHTDLSVHGQTTRYEYEDNEKASVTFKPEDLGIVEDMANVAREKVDGEADVNSNGTKKENATDYGVSQNIRRGDYNANYANANDITGQTRHNTQNVDLNIKVTYRINVVNESQTDGYANIIRDYYDDRYKLANANLVYQERELKNGKETVKYETTIAKSSVTDNVDSGNGFSAVSIPLPNGRVLSQDRMAVVYITFEMKDPNATLKPMVDGKTTKVPTYNMAEIWQYTTKGTRSQTEFTRGLLDKDSAPGSANREQVRKVSTQGRNTDLTGVNPTTVQYYFERPSQSGSNQYWKAKNDLTDLKYEDDTYAAPTLYFVDRTVQRVLSGTVYHDGLLPMDTNTYIKTGNGKLDSGEKGVAGVLVELLEVENNGNLKPIISTHTKADGSFTLTKFMPAKYALRYTYGSTRQCIVAYAVNANTNEDSFNGEDYQSTNNTGNRAGVARLADTDKDYWYITNASNKISTGTDDVNRRRTVARTVTGYTDAQMRTLQKARNTRDDRSITLSNSEVQQIADSTKMYSNTPNFLVAVEKPTGLTSKSTRFTDTYIIEEMDLGLMETPKTEITLEKKITSFTIKDASGTNTLASWNINSGKSAGDVLKLNEGDGYDVSIVDDQLQGAKLEVTFKINANVKVERNYDATGNPVQPITAVADFIDNDLSFNADLLVGDGTEHTNADYWTIVPYQTSGGVEGIQDTLRRRANEAKAYIGTVSPSDTRYNGTNGYGTLDQPGKAYSVIVKATNSNPILSPTKTSTGYTSTSSITLEKVLSSEETTIRDIVTSNINTYEYNNHVEVLNLDYTNTKTGATGNDFIFMDRIIRNPKDNDPDYDDELYGRDDKTEYVMIAGVQHDSAESERITVHPPTGEMKGNQYYYVAIGAIMIIILGVAGIKKIALKEE